MANIKKNFNFRNGVQVDDDNLLVTSTGLVGIGTTVPTEALDVRGNLNVSGSADITQANIGILTVTTLEPTKIIGAGISVVSGILTASGSGIVTFYGDARFLQGMPTSQWEDIDVGLGFTSIYNTGGNVGIATVDPRFTVQVGGDVDSSQNGVGISSVGNIKATGIVTAASFVGPVTGAITGDVSGNITGNLTGLVNSSGISTFGGINATGRIVATATNNVIPFLYGNQTDLPSPSTYHGAVAHVHATGALYYAHAGAWWELVNKESSGVVGTGTEFYNIEALESDHLNITGVSTFRDDVDFVGDPVGTALTSIQFHKGDGTNSDVDALSFYDSAAIDLGVGNTGNMRLRGNFGNSSFILGFGNNLFIDGSDVGNTTIKIRTRDARNGIVVNPDTTSGTVELYHSSGGTATKRLETSGIGVTITNQLDTTNIVASGVVTATTELNSPLIGVGTDAPANDIQVRKSGNTEIQVTSDTGIAGLTVGRESGTSNTNNAEFRYGGGAGAPYSSAQSLDILNYGTGNFNYYISANNPGASSGDFHWHKGVNSARLMTLTNTGSLGIGVTNPGEKLTVAGVCTVTSNSFVGGNLSVSGNTTVGGNLTVSGSLNIPSINTNIIGNVTGNLTGNVNATSGISSFRKIGINTTVPTESVDLDCLQANATFKRVGIGSTQPDGVLDVSGGLSQASKRFIMLPKVSAGSTAVIQADSPEGGGLIYNTTLRKLQFFNGTNWETVTSVEVTG